jgi:hypothetical protein
MLHSLHVMLSQTVKYVMRWHTTYTHPKTPRAPPAGTTSAERQSGTELVLGTLERTAMCHARSACCHAREPASSNMSDGCSVVLPCMTSHCNMSLCVHVIACYALLLAAAAPL